MRVDRVLLFGKSFQFSRMPVRVGYSELSKLPKYSSGTRHLMRNIVLATLMFFSAAQPVFADGDASSVFHKAMEVYVQNASFLIRNNIDWHMVRPSDAEAVVVIRFNPNGTFMAAKVEEHSGNPTFDVALESAVRRSIPMLPPPPMPPDASAPLSIPMRFRVQR